MPTMTFICFFYLSPRHSLPLPGANTSWWNGTFCHSGLDAESPHCSGQQLLEILSSFRGSLPHFPLWSCQELRWQCRETKLWIKVKLTKAKLRHTQLCLFKSRQIVGSSRVAFCEGYYSCSACLPFSGEGGKWLFKSETLTRGWLPVLRVFHMHWRLHPEMVVGATTREGKTFPITGHQSIWPLLTSRATKPNTGLLLLSLSQILLFHLQGNSKKSK